MLLDFRRFRAASISHFSQATVVRA
jgi:hypothetical protein